MKQENESLKIEVSEKARTMATASRVEARKLQGLPYEERQVILYAMADALVDNKHTFGSQHAGSKGCKRRSCCTSVGSPSQAN